MREHEEAGESHPGLHDFIRTSLDAIVADWLAQARTQSPARELSRPVLVDQLPQILVRIADMIEADHTGAQPPFTEAPDGHARDRLTLGFDLEEVIKEYSLLRQCILGLWEANVGPTIAVMEMRRLDSAFDQAITESSVSFARARERMLKAVDRIAESAVDSASVDTFLHRILQATLETTAAVDTAAVLLRQGDVLRARAAVGIEEEVEQGFTVQIGEGVAGKVAAEAQPILLRHAATDPLVTSQVLREKGVRAFYGIPMSHAGSVIGVAYMGSRTAFEFSEEDKLLFRTMASRATCVIVQNQLVADLEQTVADRDRLVMQLAGERARLEQILDQLPAGVLIADAPAGEFSSVNKRCRQILGEYDGWQLFHPDASAYGLAETPWQRALRGELVVDEFKILRPDGSWATIRAQAAPVRDREGRIQSAVVAFDDVSGQKRYEEHLRFLSEISRQLAESIDYEQTLAQIARLAVPAMGDWFVVDLLREGELNSIVTAHTNPAKVELVREFRRRFPFDIAQTYGVAKVLRDGTPELYEDIPDELLVAAARSDEHLAVMRELGMRSAMLVPLNVRGRTIGAVSFVSAESGRRFDRGDLEVAQGLADRAAMAIENARLFREAERAILLREEVLAVVSHDLRNPLSSIDMSAAMLLKKGAGDARTRKQLETILRAAGRMEHLIGDLLDMASIQAGRLAIERVTQEIAPIVAEAVEIAEPLAKETGQTLTSELAVGSARCSVDRERVLQLFSNLLGNAKKFCPAGGAITVRAKVTGNEVECSVSDTGPGIPEDDLPHIFDPYWSARQIKKKGIGLGLYISKGIVEAHGGRIWGENQVGAGATFYFTLPLA